MGQGESQRVRRSFAGARSETEFNLNSGDRVDAVYHLPSQTVVVEVKSRISNLVDLRRGAFQCIKYQAEPRKNFLIQVEVNKPNPTMEIQT